MIRAVAIAALLALAGCAGQTPAPGGAGIGVSVGGTAEIGVTTVIR